MEYPPEVIKRICEQKGIEPIYLLGYLLDMLVNSHRLNAGVFKDAKNKKNVFDDVKFRVEYAGRTAEPPRSLLELLDMIVEGERAESDKRSETDSRRNDEGYKTAIDHYRRATDALRLVMREMMNQAEHHGIESSLKADWFKRPDVDDPTPDTDE